MIRLDQAAMARRKVWRIGVSKTFAVICWIVAFLSVAVLLMLLYSILRQGLSHLSWDFIKGVPSRKPEEAGMWPAIVGSVIIVAICGIVALPIGVGTAILLEEYRPKSKWVRKLHGFLQLNISNLAGVPSIVYGIIGLTVFVSMFNMFGNSNDPAYQVGLRWFDQTTDEAGNYVRLQVDGRDAPQVGFADGASSVEKDAIVIRRVSGAELEALYAELDARTADADDETFAAIRDELFHGVIGPDPYIDRVSEKRPWYVQLPFGRGVLAGGLTLMLVILPIVIVSSQEALRSVPPSLREGAFGLGATKWQMVQKTVLPASVPGIMTGAILAISRAIGEAAPILILAGIVYITFTPTNLMDDFTVMPLQIYDWAGRPQKAFHEVAASGIIVLLIVLLSFNAIAVFVRQKFQKPLS
ncbi:MAG: PstA family ABC transporter permease [Phycisphaerales bacterium]